MRQHFFNFFDIFIKKVIFDVICPQILERNKNFVSHQSYIKETAIFLLLIFLAGFNLFDAAFQTKEIVVIQVNQTSFIQLKAVLHLLTAVVDATDICCLCLFSNFFLDYSGKSKVNKYHFFLWRTEHYVFWFYILVNYPQLM